MADSYFLGSEIELKHVSGTMYKASGALVYFGTGIKSADFVDDFFASDTDYDLNVDGTGEATVYFNHGKDAVIGRHKLGNQKAKLTKDERAVWIEQHLDIANMYDAMVVELIEKRKAQTGKNFGWSSGGVSHLVEREPQADGSMKIVKWPLGADASITLIPADWRQTLIPAAELKPTNIKSLLDTVSDSDGDEVDDPEAHAEGVEASQGAENETETSGTDEQKTTNSNTTEVVVMSDTPEQNANTPEKSPAMVALEQKMAKTEENINKILKFMEEAPRQEVGGYYTTDGGAADPNIKSLGDLAIAVARKDTKRLTDVYGATKTQNTLEGSAGGFLIQPQVLTDLGLNITLVSPLGSLCRSIPVSSPNGKAPIPHLKTVPSNDGQSASAGGVKGNKRKEGSAYSKEELSLEELAFDVSDFASGYVKATRLQMKAAPMIESLLRNAIEEAVANREEWAILNGSGNGEPLGVLNWDGKIEVTEDTQDQFVAADVDEMISRLLVTMGGNVAWAHSYNAYTKVSPLARPNPAVSGNRGEAPMSSLSGYPYYRTQHLPAVGTDGYIVVGDWSKYLKFEYGGLDINYSDQRYADESKVAWFFTKWMDGKPIMPTSVTLEDGTTTVSPFIVIKRA